MSTSECVIQVFKSKNEQPNNGGRNLNDTNRDARTTITQVI